MADQQGRKSGDRGRYHHGDLRCDLLRVAREAIARHGAGTVSLTSLARLAGVSQPAPYRHFTDREALLEAVSAEAFGEFAAGLADAIQTRAPQDALEALALAYLAFGEANPELYRLMFASRLTPRAKSGSDLDEASGKAFDLLRTAVSNVLSSANADDVAYLVWARLHGLVMLKADGFITRSLAGFVSLPGLLEGSSGEGPVSRAR